MSSPVESNTAVLRVQGLGFAYPGHDLFHGLNADFPAGLSLVQRGDGAGKTSLLRLLAGDCAAQAGCVTLNGVDAVRDAARYRAQVFWRDPRAPWPERLTPQAWADELAARYPSWSHALWQAHAAGLGLAPHLGKPMYQLSAGSQRKVLLAAALASGAALTLLDEPVAALDKPSIAYLLQALEAEARTPPWPGRVLVVAHYDALGELPWRRTLLL
ncbi:MAG: ATP-binding cassette domain-containing protein [Proteobacteria bacterium]|nr:ATP-binding cassette domain-containing protein [Pseudomonadota bacterium]